MNKKEKERLDWTLDELLRDIVGGYIYVTNGLINQINTFVIIENIGTYDISIKKREGEAE